MTTSVSSSKTTDLEVVEKRRDRLIQRGQESVAKSGEVGDMRIPGLDDPHRGLNDGNARLDQTARDQQRTAKQMAAVAVDQTRVFACGVQRLAHLPIAEHGQRGVLLIDERSRAGSGRRPGRADAGAGAAAAGSSPAGKVRLSSPASGSSRVEAELPGIVPGAEESRVLPRPRQRAFDEPRRQGHAAGDAVARGAAGWSRTAA